MSEEFENVFLQIRPQWKNDRREDVFRKFMDASERLNGKYIIQEVQFAFEIWSASQAREAELREKLEAAEALNSLQAQSIGMLSKELEAAEARIKASQEQEPVRYLYRYELLGGTALCTELRGDQEPLETVPLYAQPPILPELAELQHENAELRKLLESKVPEGWQLVPNTMTEEMGGAFQDAWFKCIGTEKGFALRSKLAYEAALSVATQPKEPKQ